MANPKQRLDRRQYIGGSDARTIMGKDEKALHRLWRKREAKRRQSIYRPS